MEPLSWNSRDCMNVEEHPGILKARLKGKARNKTKTLKPLSRGWLLSSLCICVWASCAPGAETRAQPCQLCHTCVRLGSSRPFGTTLRLFLGPREQGVRNWQCLPSLSCHGSHLLAVCSVTNSQPAGAEWIAILYRWVAYPVSWSLPLFFFFLKVVIIKVVAVSPGKMDSETK